MERQTRLIADGLVYHALNRGNNRAPVFFKAAGYQTFLQALGQSKTRYPFLTSVAILFLLVQTVRFFCNVVVS